MYGNSRRPACKHFNQTHIPSDMELLATILVIVLLIPWSGAQKQSCGTTYKEGDTATLTFTLSADFKINFPQYISVEFYRRGSGGRPGDHLVDDCYLETDDDLCKTTNERYTFQRLDSGRSNVLNIQKVTDNDVGSYLFKLTSDPSITLQACIEVKKGDDSTRPPSTTPNAVGSSDSSSDSVGGIVGGVLGCVVAVVVIVAVVVLCWRRKKNRSGNPDGRHGGSEELDDSARELLDASNLSPVNTNFLHGSGNPDGRHGGRDELNDPPQPSLGAGGLSLANTSFLHGSSNPDGRHGGRDELNDPPQPPLGAGDLSLADDKKATEEEEVATRDVKVAPGEEEEPIQETTKATEETGGAEEEEASGSAGGPTGQGHQTEDTAVGSPGHVAAMKDRFENQKQTPGTATARSEEGM